jgi:hypothetical protein
VLFQISQFSFGSILLLDIPKNLLDIFLEYIIVSKHNLGRIPSCSNNLSFNYLIDYKIINISLDLIESYITEVTDNI